MPVRAVLLTCALAASLVLAACVARNDNLTAPTPPFPPSAASCDAAKAQFAVGFAASADLLERARVAAQAGSARFIRPNEPITMEFLGSRLNLNLGAADVVHSAHCG